MSPPQPLLTPPLKALKSACHCMSRESADDGLLCRSCPRHGHTNAAYTTAQWVPGELLLSRPWTAPLTELEYRACSTDQAQFYASCRCEQAAFHVGSGVCFVEAGGGLRVARIKHIMALRGLPDSPSSVHDAPAGPHLDLLVTLQTYAFAEELVTGRLPQHGEVSSAVIYCVVGSNCLCLMTSLRFRRRSK